MAKVERVLQIQVTITTEEQKRGFRIDLPLDLGIRNGQLTGDANAALAEQVRKLTSGLNEKAGQTSMFRELLERHEREVQEEERRKAEQEGLDQAADD